jgi:O-acetylserine/cysteine efflux transporter
MPVRDMTVAVLASVIWGLAFVTYPFALEGFSAPQLTALRFLIAGLPVVLVPRPRVAWRSIVLVGLTLFAGQFLLLFFAFVAGMPAGLASVTQQMQAFFTVLLAAVFLREVPTGRHGAGIGIAFAGLALIGLSTGADLKPVALGLALAAALSWAVGNILVKRLAGVPVFPLMVWASLVAPVPAFLLASLDDRHPPFIDAIAAASWPAIAATVYLGTLATPVAYGMWGGLLQRHPAALVAPFALISPCTGVVASALMSGEAFGPMRYAGMALILAGLAVVVLPASGLRAWVGQK